MKSIKFNSVRSKNIGTGTITDISAIQGAPGVSPTASVQRVSGGAEITVVDSQGTTTAKVYDGSSCNTVHLKSDGNTIWLFEDEEQTSLTYTQIKTLVENEQNIVYLTNGYYSFYNKYYYQPSISAQDNSAIGFIGSTQLNGKVYSYRIVINEDNEVSADEIELAKESELALTNDALTELNGTLDTLTITVGTKANSSDLTSLATKTELNTKANDSVVVKSVNGVAPTNGNVDVPVEVPESIIATSVDNYLDTHGGVYATQVDFENAIYYERQIIDITSDFNIVTKTYLDKTTGNIVSTTSNASVTINRAEVEVGDIFLITGQYGWSGALLVEYNANGEFVRSISSSSQADAVDYEFIVPTGTKYLSFGSYNGLTIKKKKYVSVKDHISSLEGMFTEYQSKNLFNPDDVEHGYVDRQGAWVDYAGYTCPKFIEVEGGENYVISGWDISSGQRKNLGTVMFAQYDSDKNFVSSSGWTSVNNITLDSNIKYIRFSYTTASWRDIQVEKNTTKTSYKPYKRFYGIPEQNVVDRDTGKLWVVVGDSLTEENNATTKHYYDYISDEYGFDIYNMGVGGSGYIKRASENLAFYQRITSCPTNADVVTIFGSGNDLSEFANIGTYTDTTTDTICGCINKTLDNYFAVCPTTPIGIIAPSPWMNFPTTQPNNNMEQYTEKLRQIAEYRGVPFLDLYHCSNLRPEDTTNRNLCFYSGTLDGNGDGCHPNELGHKIIATKIKEFVKSLI